MYTSGKQDTRREHSANNAFSSKVTKVTEVTRGMEGGPRRARHPRIMYKYDVESPMFKHFSIVNHQVTLVTMVTK